MLSLDLGLSPMFASDWRDLHFRGFVRRLRSSGATVSQAKAHEQSSRDQSSGEGTIPPRLGSTIRLCAAGLLRTGPERLMEGVVVRHRTRQDQPSQAKPAAVDRGRRPRADCLDASVERGA
jgi:hypothetical protein